MNKYEYLWVVQGYYAQGWEDVDCGNYFDTRVNLALYKQNESNTPFRRIQRRVLNAQNIEV